MRAALVACAVRSSGVALLLIVMLGAGCRTNAQSDQQDAKQVDVHSPAAHARSTSPGPLHDLDWLAGCWQGSQGDLVVEETWTEPAVDRMLATGRTFDVASGRTVFFEFLRIEARSDRLVYIALPGGRGETAFPATKVEKNRLRFENPEHDDPKVIEYRLEADGTLVTRVEGTHTEEVKLRRVW
jgi:hypothetical protein